MIKSNAIKNPDLQDKYQYLAQNLRDIFREKDLNANQLAQILGIPMMTIRRLLSGETTDPRISTLKILADYFGVTVDSLVEKAGLMGVKYSRNARPIFVPKLNWEIVGKISSLNDINLTEWKDWQAVSLSGKEKVSNNAFALESRPSMYPRFPHGTIFIFDSDITPKDGDIVLIKLKSNDELTLRELVIDPPEWQLHSVISASNVMPYSGNQHKIVGINILTLLFNRKDFD